MATALVVVAIVVLAFAAAALVDSFRPRHHNDHGNRPCVGKAAGVCTIGPVTTAN